MNFIDVIFYFILLVILYNFFIYVSHVLSLRKYPPGPFPVPIIGNLHLIDRKKPFETFRNLGKVYGDVVSVSIGSKRIVVVNTIEPAREAMVQKAGDFAGRPHDNYALNMVTRRGADLVMSDYSPEWSGRRKLASKAMKISVDHGCRLEEKMMKQISQCSERIRDKMEKSFDLKEELMHTNYNIISQLVFGDEHANTNEEEFQRIKNAINYFQEAMFYGNPISIFPFLKYFPIKIVQSLTKHESIMESCLSKHHNEHKQNVDTLKNSNSFLSTIMNTAMDEVLLKKYGLQKMSDSTVKGMMSDVIIGMVDAVVANLLWMFLYLLHHPQYLDEAYDEIITALGNNQYPKVKDRSSLPKIQAIIQESLRLSTGPTTIPHKATKDSTIAGFPIPKGTTTLFNLWSIHRDQRYWEDPEEFKPYRWIDENGNFNSQKKRESYLPFLVGKRACIGERIARENLFLILTRMIVDFKIEGDPNQQLPSMTEGVVGIEFYPKPYNVIFRER